MPNDRLIEIITCIFPEFDETFQGKDIYNNFIEIMEQILGEDIEGKASGENLVKNIISNALELWSTTHGDEHFIGKEYRFNEEFSEYLGNILSQK